MNEPTTYDISQLEVRHLRQHSDLFKLYKEMGEESQPLLRIMELAYRSGARYCLLWHDPNNEEWISEYSGLYSKIHPLPDNYVLRLDFFSEHPLESAGGKYIGYVSLRPGPKKTVVEAIIPLPSSVKGHYLLSKGNWETAYPGADGSYIRNNIVDACPFVQQDGVIGICAHASIRMLSMVLARNFTDCERMNIREIQDKVIAMPLLEGSHLPATGLTSFEIVNAIEAMGAVPTLYTFEEGRERTQRLSLEQIIYPYVESGIPVMVGIRTESGGHSILVVGHTFDRDSWWQQAEMGYFPSLARGVTWVPSYMWTPEFIIQDDNFGPYLSTSRTVLGMATQYIVVPIPSGCPVLLPGYRAESLVAGYMRLKEVTRYITSNTRTYEPWRTIMMKLQKKGQLVLRPLLITKENFLEHLSEIRLSEEIRERYREFNLPPWLWLIEISVPELYSRLLKVGEALLNPSYPIQHIRTGREPLLSLRIFDVTSIGNQFTETHVTRDRRPVRLFAGARF